MIKVNTQIIKIKEKLILAKKKDNKKRVFGASSHKYKFKKPLTEDALTTFEAKYNIILPDAYKAFVTEIGNEGKSYPNSVVNKCVAGPYYGIYPLERNNEDLLYNPLEYLQKPFSLHEMSDEKWDALIKDLPDNDEAYTNAINNFFSGILPIGSQGCTGVIGLVLNGEQQGKVVYLDQGLSKPIFTNTYFLDWYENWLDEILQNKDFEKKLLAKLQTKDESHIIEAIDSLTKFKKLENLDNLLPLLNHSNNQICNKALFLLTEHQYKKAKKHLLRLIQSNDDGKSLIAFQSIRWHVKKKKRLAKLTRPILHRLEKVKEEELLRFGLCILNKAKADISPLLKQLSKSKKTEFRNNAYYNIGLLRKNTDFKDVLIKGMSFEDNNISITVLQSIEKLNSPELITHYKALLERIPNDRYIISNIMVLLEGLGSETFDDEIHEYLKKYFDSIENNDDYELSNLLIDFHRIPLPKLLKHAKKHHDKNIAKQAKKKLKKLKKYKNDSK